MAKNILIPFPKNYADRVKSSLEQNFTPDKLKVHCIPLIATVPVEELSQMREFLDDIDSYDYIAFCSRTAIEYFAGYIKELGASLPSGLGYCAIGADNQALEQCLGLKPTFVAPKASPKGIVEWFEEHPEHRGKKIAVLSPKVVDLIQPIAIPQFINDLKNYGLTVTEVASYITRPADKTLLDQLKSIAADLDGVAFGSATEIEVFIEAIGADNNHISHMIFSPLALAHAKKLGIKDELINSDFKEFDNFTEDIRNWVD